MTTIRIPDLNDLARYRPEIADLTERVRARDLGAIDRAREVLAELDVIAAQLGAAFVEAGGDPVRSPAIDLVYQLAGDEELSSELDEIDEPERTRRLWEDTIRPQLEAVGHSPAEIEALRVEYEVPA